MKTRVLVVDDNQDFLHLMKNRFEHWGYDVLLARDRKEFERLALYESPDLIVLDILLGDDNGPQIYGALLDRGLDKQIPVIFLSALVEEKPSSRNYPGRHCCLHPKPIDSQELLNEVHQLVSCRAA